ncbi:hypothetical protein ACFLZM_00110 [Thermodesulfobacteriota bacterium]
MKKNTVKAVKKMTLDEVKAELDEILNSYSQVVEIDLPSGYPPPDIHCPACGALIVSTKEGTDLCEHSLFAYIDMFGEGLRQLVYVSPKYEKLVGKAPKDAERYLIKLLNNLYKPSSLILKVTFGGRACIVKFQTTGIIAFDFCPGEVDDIY